MYLFDPIYSARVFSNIGLEPATPAEMADVDAIAQDLIGGETAGVATLSRIQDHAQTVVLVHRENGRVMGFLAWLPLTAEGLRALIDGDFKGLDPSPDHVCRPGEVCVAVYGWGYAGRTRRASAVVIKGVVQGRQEVCPQIPFFTRGSTADGARLLAGRLHAEPFPIDRPGLFWSPPLIVTAKDAAA
jgi:hypothetical protein